MKLNLRDILRIAAGLLFLAIGLSHFYYTLDMAIFVPLPTGAKLFVYLVGACIIVPAVLVLLNKSVKQSFVAIACALALSAAFVQGGIEWHNPDEILSQVGLVNISKLLIAFLVLLFVIYFPAKK